MFRRSTAHVLVCDGIDVVLGDSFGHIVESVRLWIMVSEGANMFKTTPLLSPKTTSAAAAAVAYTYKEQVAKDDERAQDHVDSDACFGFGAESRPCTYG